MTVHYYLDVSFYITPAPVLPVDDIRLKLVIQHGLKTLFGEYGAAIDVDILKYISKERRVILRCLSSLYVKVRSSLSFVSEFETVCYTFHINKASSSLLSLQSNSRTYKFV